MNDRIVTIERITSNIIIYVDMIWRSSVGVCGARFEFRASLTLIYIHISMRSNSSNSNVEFTHPNRCIVQLLIEYARFDWISLTFLRQLIEMTTVLNCEKKIWKTTFCRRWKKSSRARLFRTDQNICEKRVREWLASACTICREIWPVVVEKKKKCCHSGSNLSFRVRAGVPTHGDLRPSIYGGHVNYQQK